MKFRGPEALKGRHSTITNYLRKERAGLCPLSHHHFPLSRGPWTFPSRFFSKLLKTRKIQHRNLAYNLPTQRTRCRERSKGARAIGGQNGATSSGHPLLHTYTPQDPHVHDHCNAYVSPRHR